VLPQIRAVGHGAQKPTVPSASWQVCMAVQPAPVWELQYFAQACEPLDVSKQSAPGTHTRPGEQTLPMATVPAVAQE
jgi:hypothetical protein